MGFSAAMADALITGAVLAGGQSRRLGRDKASLELAGKPLAQWVMAAIAPWVAESWLSTNQPLRHVSLGYPCLLDLWPGRGALGGLLSVMLVAQGEWILLAACDAPFLQPALLQAMIHRTRIGRPDAIICQSSRGVEPLPGLFHRRLQRPLEKQVKKGPVALRAFLTAHRLVILPPEEVHRHDPAERSFINLNTPADMAEVLSRLGHDL
jgi:molybdopterin-guanine dinucleotide biosynthesis protein A